MRIISLFCGAGGMDLGFKLAGHRIVWANDNDPDSVETYQANIGRHAVLGDIEKVEISSIPDGDVVIGGFPCQGFSMANLQRDVKDERNKLYTQFLRVVREKRPMYFLAENVKGILSLGNGSVIKRILGDFSRAGYRVQYKLFNAADYGVPQLRQRVIIAGTRNDLPEEMDYRFPEPTHCKNPGVRPSLERWKTIGEALRNVHDPREDKADLPNHIFSKYKVTDRNFTGHRKTDPHKPSPTILARGNGKGGVCALNHPKGHRRLSVRESAIVQTFPIEFEFHGKMGSCYRQVGNAVPVAFARRLGEQLKYIEKELL